MFRVSGEIVPTPPPTTTPASVGVSVSPSRSVSTPGWSVPPRSPPFSGVSGREAGADATSVAAVSRGRGEACGYSLPCGLQARRGRPGVDGALAAPHQPRRIRVPQRPAAALGTPEPERARGEAASPRRPCCHSPTLLGDLSHASRWRWRNALASPARKDHGRPIPSGCCACARGRGRCVMPLPMCCAGCSCAKRSRITRAEEVRGHAAPRRARATRREGCTRTLHLDHG